MKRARPDRQNVRIIVIARQVFLLPVVLPVLLYRWVRRLIEARKSDKTRYGEDQTRQSRVRRGLRGCPRTTCSARRSPRCRSRSRTRVKGWSAPPPTPGQAQRRPGSTAAGGFHTPTNPLADRRQHRGRASPVADTSAGDAALSRSARASSGLADVPSDTASSFWPIEG